MKYQIVEVWEDSEGKKVFSKPFEGKTCEEEGRVLLTFKEDFDGQNASYEAGETIWIRPECVRVAE